MNTPTPETDAAEFIPDMCSLAKVVKPDFARKLERERDEARKQYNHWRTAHGHCSNSREVLIAERDQLRKVCELFMETLIGLAEEDLFDDQIVAKKAYNQLPHVKK